MYAEEENEVVTVMHEIMSVPHKGFKSRVQHYFDRKEEWILCYRKNIITRNNNTNNYAEASIRVLKDIVLGRTKAFNVIALVEFCVNVFEKYLCSRLLNFANNRRATSVSIYEGLLKKTTEEFRIENIIKLDDENYQVPSSQDPTTLYTVNIRIGLCECLFGRNGAFCKHQAILHQHYNTNPPNLPILTTDMRYSLAKLALGINCPNRSFYENFRIKDVAEHDDELGN